MSSSRVSKAPRSGHRGLAIGICLGAALGAALGRLAIGVAIGIALGLGLDATSRRLRPTPAGDRVDAEP